MQYIKNFRVKTGKMGLPSTEMWKTQERKVLEGSCQEVRRI